MKLTSNVLAEALNVINPEGKLTLALRNQGIVYMENLGSVCESFPVLDLTNNNIDELEDIPEHGIFETILLANNNISSLGQESVIAAANGIHGDAGNSTDSNLKDSVPKSTCPYSCYSLRSLSLINNNVSTFSELAKLHRFPNLQILYMTGNPIYDEHHYRLFAVWILPNLRILDGEKVKMAERTAATELFGVSLNERQPAADALLHVTTTRAAAPKETRLMNNAVKKLSPEERKKLVAELEQALSMTDIERISTALKMGYVE